VSRDERERLRDIVEARHHHQYYRIQKQIIEDTVKRDLPELLRAVRALSAGS
jgi:uncharacterized protein with HEPN domain